MKKIVSLILAAAMAAMMLFAFASCGKKDDDTLVCGVTLVDRINYKDENGEWLYQREHTLNPQDKESDILLPDFEKAEKLK